MDIYEDKQGRMSCILSIIVISHNQKEELCRCIDSIIAQPLPFEHEIIISDDASTDGTWDLILEYQGKYPNIIKAYQCDSNDCFPDTTSHRSGWNRCNAYPHATGKYIAHVDADDYFRPGANVYARQVEMLEKHPECSMAMSNILKIHDGEDLSNASTWFDNGVVIDGKIISGEEYIQKQYLILNQAFIQRRIPEIDPIRLYGKRYVDPVITFHHLQFGPLICVNACDYVYVQYSKSITGQLASSHDTDILWCLGLYIPALIPHWRHSFYLSDYLGIMQVVKLARSNYSLSINNKASLKDLNLYIYNTFNRRLRFIDKTRLFFAGLFLQAMHKLNCHSKSATNCLHILLCK